MFRLLTEAADFSGLTNFLYDFTKLTKKYGKEYRNYIKDAYAAKDQLSDTEFCKLNHLPLNLLDKFTK